MGRRRKKGNPIHGWVLIDKPIGLSSTQVLYKVRGHFNAQKAGHGGTLDPMATGLLPIALGEATKLISHALHGDKTYEFTIRWGQATDSHDAEGEVIFESDVRPSAADIKVALPAFIGNIKQRPPKFSAIKIDGKRAYNLARAGKEVEIKERDAEIYDFELLNMPDSDHARFKVSCAAGTYVRALCRDLAEKLGTYGHLVKLRRIKASGIDVKDAILLDDFLDLSQDAAKEQVLLNVGEVLDDIPALKLTSEEARCLRLGQSLRFITRPERSRLLELGLNQQEDDLSALAVADGVPIAMVRINGPEIKPVRVLLL